MVKILIADDHAIVRRGLIQILKDQYPFAEIEETADSDELTAKALKGSWDIIISDISMPGRGVLEVLRLVKETHPNIPWLILSMHPEDQYALRVIKAGASAYLNKEMAQEELINAVKQVLSGKKYFTATVAERMATALSKKTANLPHELLSDREFEVMKQLASGKSLSDIAENLSLGITTISTYRSRILTKMDMKSNAELTRYAIEHHLI
jgi:DNA-binding NarL/FixJ family response regulator